MANKWGERTGTELKNLCNATSQQGKGINGSVCQNNNQQQKAIPITRQTFRWEEKR